MRPRAGTTTSTPRGSRPRAARPSGSRCWAASTVAASTTYTYRVVALSGTTAPDAARRRYARFTDGSTLVDELGVANAHPNGARPFAREQYVDKFRTLTEGLITTRTILDLPEPELVDLPLDAETRAAYLGAYAFIALPNAFVGVRETRNVTGLYELNENDIRIGAKFHDTVGQGCFPVDIHHPDG